MLKIDLRTKVIPQGQVAYMLHPGKNYHLFHRFIAHESVSTDLPNLELPNCRSPSKAIKIDTQIIRARALRDWLSLNREERNNTQVSTQLSDYEAEEKRRHHDSYLENLEELLWNLPTNTTLFVPNPDLSGEGFFCELSPAKDDRVIFNGSGSAKNLLYTGRKVANIKRIPMRLIPPEILESKNRNSILTELDDYLTERLYRLYYGTFSVIGGNSQMEIVVPTASFQPVDSVVIGAVANFIEENLQKFENGKIDSTHFSDAIFLAFDEAELQLHARLNSEGIVQVAAKSLSPVLASIFIAISGNISANKLVENAASSDIKIVNSICPEDDEYPREISKRLYGILDMLGEEEISEVCLRIDQLKNRTKVTVPTQIVR